MLGLVYTQQIDLPQLVCKQITHVWVDGWFSHCDRCDQ